MQKELTDLQPVLVVTAKEVEDMMVTITADKASADATKQQVAVQEAEATAQVRPLCLVADCCDRSTTFERMLCRQKCPLVVWLFQSTERQSTESCLTASPIRFCLHKMQVSECAMFGHKELLLKWAHVERFITGYQLETVHCFGNSASVHEKSYCFVFKAPALASCAVF